MAQKIYTKAIAKVSSEESTLLPIGGKVSPNPLIPSLIPLDQLLFAELYTYVLAKLLQNGAKFSYIKLTPDFKNHMRNLNKLQASR